MNMLLVIPSISTVRILKASCRDNGECKIIGSHVTHLRPHATGDRAIRSFRGDFRPELIVLFVPRDGVGLTGPTPLDAKLLGELRANIARTPYHLGALLEANSMLGGIFPSVPQVLVSGSAFFSTLPEKEIVPAIASTTNIIPSRTGFHGVFHRAAYDAAVAELHNQSGARVLSICLDVNSEATAIVNGSPVFVTGGSTPLEGLPGDTTCGEIDPGIVLLLGDSVGLGPEEIAEILTRESGFTGLAGKPSTLRSVYESESPEDQDAWRVFNYRLVQMMGKALAAMNGIDAIVFSGRYAEAGNAVGCELLAHLSALPTKPQPLCIAVEKSFEELLAREAQQLLNAV